MIMGALIVLGRNFSGINIGDFFILAATMCGPAGNFFQQKARQIASSEIIMFLRSLFSVPALFLLAFVLRESASLADIRASFIFLLINGALLLGLSKILWIEAIHRISVTKAVALNSLTPFLTLILAWLILGQQPNLWQISALVPLVLGVLFLTDTFAFKRE